MGGVGREWEEGEGSDGDEDGSGMGREAGDRVEMRVGEG